MKKIILALAAAGLSLPALAAGTTVYSNDFTSGAGAAWSNQSTTTAPSGETFLGQFGNDSTTLSLSGLGAHTAVTISFDLYIIRSMDGYAYGPDLWGMNIGNGAQTLSNFTTNFSNWSGSQQAFPNAFFSGFNAAQTGAAAVDTLGYGTGGWGDATYKLSFTVNHTGSTFNTTFWGAGQQGVSDEGWGLDNVKVSVTAVPEPESYAMLLAGLGLMGTIARRRSKSKGV